MASIELTGPEPSACPLLGLATDRRSHFTYPHPEHRCFAEDRPAKTDAGRQASYCLGSDYTACDRYQTRQRQAQRREEGKPPHGASEVSSERPGPGGAGSPGTVIHVYRAGDSLTSLATRYGVTVGQIETANGLPANAVVADDTRLNIPLRPPASRSPRRAARQNPEGGSD
jgi:hypothetical protein